LLWAEAANGGWHADADGRPLERRDAFGLTNAFAVPARGRIDVHYERGTLAALVRALQLVAWIVVIAAWFVTRRKRASTNGAAG
jgi:hypothetical protein